MTARRVEQRIEVVTGSTLAGASPVISRGEVPKLLSEGWRVVSVTPMGGAGGGESAVASFAALVVLERDAGGT